MCAQMSVSEQPSQFIFQFRNSGKEFVESVETRRGFVRLRHNEPYNDRYNDFNRVHATLEIHFPQGAVLRMNGSVSSIDLKSLKTLLY